MSFRRCAMSTKIHFRKGDPCDHCGSTSGRCTRTEDGLYFCLAADPSPGWYGLGPTPHPDFRMFRLEGTALPQIPPEERARLDAEAAARNEAARAAKLAEWLERVGGESAMRPLTEGKFSRHSNPTSAPELHRHLFGDRVIYPGRELYESLGARWIDRSGFKDAVTAGGWRWAFPMLRGDGGPREAAAWHLRSAARKDNKLFVAGHGLFVPTHSPGVMFDSPRMWVGGPQWHDATPMWTVEGAADTLAAALMGQRAIGRPSNLTGAEDLAEYLKRHVRRDLWAPHPNTPDAPMLLVVAENDAKYSKAEELIWAGRDGAIVTAHRLAQMLGVPVGWALPPRHVNGAWVKDLRDYVTNSARALGRLDPRTLGYPLSRELADRAASGGQLGGVSRPGDPAPPMPPVTLDALCDDKDRQEWWDRHDAERSRKQARSLFAGTLLKGVSQPAADPAPAPASAQPRPAETIRQRKAREKRERAERLAVQREERRQAQIQAQLDEQARHQAEARRAWLDSRTPEQLAEMERSREQERLRDEAQRVARRRAMLTYEEVRRITDRLERDRPEYCPDCGRRSFFASRDSQEGFTGRLRCRTNGCPGCMQDKRVANAVRLANTLLLDVPAGRRVSTGKRSIWRGGMPRDRDEAAKLPFFVGKRYVGMVPRRCLPAIRKAILRSAARLGVLNPGFAWVAADDGEHLHVFSQVPFKDNLGRAAAEMDPHRAAEWAAQACAEAPGGGGRERRFAYAGCWRYDGEKVRKFRRLHLARSQAELRDLAEEAGADVRQAARGGQCQPLDGGLFFRNDDLKLDGAAIPTPDWRELLRRLSVPADLDGICEHVVSTAAGTARVGIDGVEPGRAVYVGDDWTPWD